MFVLPQEPETQASLDYLRCLLSSNLLDQVKIAGAGGGGQICLQEAGKEQSIGQKSCRYGRNCPPSSPVKSSPAGPVRLRGSWEWESSGDWWLHFWMCSLSSCWTIRLDRRVGAGSRHFEQSDKATKMLEDLSMGENRTTWGFPGSNNKMWDWETWTERRRRHVSCAGCFAASATSAGGQPTTGTP